MEAKIPEGLLENLPWELHPQKEHLSKEAGPGLGDPSHDRFQNIRAR